MTGYDIFKSAMSILGYSTNDSEIKKNEMLFSLALDAINQICDDLKIDNIFSLNECINEKKGIYNALRYGTAMLLSLKEGDSEKNKVVTSYYSQFRATALSKTAYVVDELPTIYFGGD